MKAKIIGRVRYFPLTVEFETLVESNYVSKHDSSFGITSVIQPLVSTVFYTGGSNTNYYPNVNYSQSTTRMSPSTTVFDSRSYQKKIVKARVLNAEKLSIGWRLMDLKRKRKFCLLWKGRPCEIEDLGKGLVKIIKLY